MDTDGDGTLSADEVRSLLRRMNLADGEAAVEQALAELDADASGDIDQEEFAAWFEAQDNGAKDALLLTTLADGMEAASLLAGQMHRSTSSLERTASPLMGSGAGNSHTKGVMLNLGKVAIECDCAIGARLPDGRPDAVRIFLAKERAQAMNARSPKRSIPVLAARLHALRNFIEKNKIERPLDWDLEHAAGKVKKKSGWHGGGDSKARRRLLLLGVAGTGKEAMLTRGFKSWAFEPVWSCWETGSTDALGTVGGEEVPPPLPWASGPLLQRANAVVLLLGAVAELGSLRVLLGAVTAQQPVLVLASGALAPSDVEAVIREQAGATAPSVHVLAASEAEEGLDEAGRWLFEALGSPQAFDQSAVGSYSTEAIPITT